MAALVAAVLISIPIYVTPCLEHPTCETPVAEAGPKEDVKEDSPPSTTTTAPSPPPTTSAPAASPASTGVEGWRELVAAYFPADQVDFALVVLECESNGDPSAQNPSGASGLFQVMPFWAPEFGYTAADLFDPAINVAVAYQVWLQQGWAAWSCA